MDLNWRPDFDPRVVRREMEIIRNDLHCNAVRVVARDIGRLVIAAEAALDAGLEVWCSPALWDRSPDATLAHIEAAAAAAERLRARAPDRVVRPLLGGRLGATYPDMPWEPKEAFRAVAHVYAAMRIDSGPAGRPGVEQLEHG